MAVPAALTYSEEDVDELIRRLEHDVERQLSTRDSAVKAIAAERDVLKAAEHARDLLVKAVKGEKERLDRVFGGSCERIGRLRWALDRVTFSDMHAKDTRWQHLRDCVETVEAVLKDLGTFKPWVPPTLKAPERITYKGVRRRISPGRRLNLKPDVEGDQVTSWSVEPALPRDLELTATGIISGMLIAGAMVEETTYVITGSNKAGEARTELTFAVKEAPPVSLTYQQAKEQLELGEVIRWEPDFSGGTVREWSVVPALPRALALDPSGGVISGTAQEALRPTTYEVSASNAGGKAVVTLQLSVAMALPQDLGYRALSSDEPVVLARGTPVHFVPEGAISGLSFSVSPDLPEGLQLDEATGVISGVPRTATSGSYKVTATCAGSEVTSTFALEVKPMPPKKVAFTGLSELPVNPTSGATRLWLGEPVHLKPEVDGEVSSFSVTPELPPGLDFDGATGAISGSPSDLAGPSSWIVTAHNDAGDLPTELRLEILISPPSGLSFELPEESSNLPVLQPCLLRPSVKGQVEEFTISPSLPEGLEFSNKTGIIRGMPLGVAERTTYEVTAMNSSGSSSTSLTFGVLLAAPLGLEYPQLKASCHVGEELSAAPQVYGGPTSFSISPPLPEGLTLNGETGVIGGVATSATPRHVYVITAANAAGEVAVDLNLEVVVPPPSTIAYPFLSPSYAVGEPTRVEPTLDGCQDCTFSVTPSLPEGLELSKTTGVITGTPVAVCAVAQYRVTATNASGSSEVVLTFEVIETVDEEQVAGSISKHFAAQVEATEDLTDLPAEPSRIKMMGDWMIWMVHRAHLNDPTLVDFNFANMHMPPPHIEARIAPKLMKAMETNTHVQVLTLGNSNMQKVQGTELAAALAVNRTLQVVNLENNCLDSAAVKEIANAIASNPTSNIETLRIAQQRGLNSFGRPVEEAVGQLMERNERITKLGFECIDAHWRNLIDRALLRNNDLARRRRKSSDQEEELLAEEKSLGRLVLELPPEKPAAEVFCEAGAPHAVFFGFVANQKRLPTTSQLQSYASSNGTPLKYSTVAPLIKDCRAAMLDASMGTQVTVGDVFEVTQQGTLRSWSISNENWHLDIMAADRRRYAYRASKEPVLALSDAWADWLQKR